MAKKNKELVQLTKESQDYIIKILDKCMPDDLRFVFDSRGYKVFIQNIAKEKTYDNIMGFEVTAGHKIEIKNDNIELSIAEAISTDLKKMLTSGEMPGILYSFGVWKIEDGYIHHSKAIRLPK